MSKNMIQATAYNPAILTRGWIEAVETTEHEKPTLGGKGGHKALVDLPA